MVKAVWIVLLVLLPFLTSIVFLIVRGGGMAERNAAASRANKEQQDAYIRNVAAASPADQIARAKELADAGTITEEEFASLKAKALA